MDEIPWAATDIQVQEEEVRLGSFDGWLYTKFQLFKMLNAVQEVPALRDLAQFTAWDGLARSLDKAFGMVYMKDDKDAQVAWRDNSAKAILEGKKVNTQRQVNRDGVAFVQTVPDSMNPRYQLFVSIITRYAPLGFLNEELVPDTSLALGDRLSSLSEINLQVDPVAKLKQLQNPGTVLLENMVVAFVDAGMLTIGEARDAIYSIAKREKAESVFKKGTALGNRFSQAGTIR